MSTEWGSSHKPEENIEHETFNEEHIWLNLNEIRNVTNS